MGYYTYVAGELEITPPLNDEENNAIEAFFRESYNFLDATLSDFDGGESGVPSTWIEIDVSTKLGYGDQLGPSGTNFEVEIAFLTGVLRGWGHMIEGQFTCDGEESDDFWRVTVSQSYDIEYHRGEIHYSELGGGVRIT